MYATVLPLALKELKEHLLLPFGRRWADVEALAVSRHGGDAVCLHRG